MLALLLLGVGLLGLRLRDLLNLLVLLFLLLGYLLLRLLLFLHFLLGRKHFWLG